VDPVDYAYARYIFSWIPQHDLSAVIGQIRGVMKDDGILMIRDGMNSSTRQVWGGSPSLSRLMENSDRLWTLAENRDVGLILPSLLVEHGFQILHVQSDCPILRTNSLEFRPIYVYLVNRVNALKQKGIFTAEVATEILYSLETLLVDECGFYCPSMSIEIIAKKTPSKLVPNGDIANP